MAMNRLGGMSNTGEGGEDPARYRPMPNGDSANCGIKQVASARFGVTIEYLSQREDLADQDGPGGEAGRRRAIARPQGHRGDRPAAAFDPGRVADLAAAAPRHLLHRRPRPVDLRPEVRNPGVQVSVKLVSEVGVGTVAAGVAKGHADEVLISGHDGGTGASPLSSIKHAGGPWEFGLAETQQTLVLNGLRDRILVQVDGQLKTGRDVVVGALWGPSGSASARPPWFPWAASSCGSATWAPARRASPPRTRTCGSGLPARPIRGPLPHVRGRGVRRLMAELGFRKFDDMVGRVDRLSCRKAIEHWKAKGLDFSAIFAPPDQSNGCALRCVRPQSDMHKDHLDWQILEQIGPAIQTGSPPSSRCPSATSIARWGRSSAAASSNGTAAAGCPTARWN